jgi:hypothetical protein
VKRLRSIIEETGAELQQIEQLITMALTAAEGSSPPAPEEPTSL